MISLRLKYSVSFLLAALYLFTISKPLVPMLHYASNYHTYVTELCENKDKPELQCKGTCQLAKTLNLDNDSEKPAKPVLPTFESLDWYISHLLNESDIFTGKTATAEFNSFKERFTPDYFIDLPTPPPRMIS